MICLQNRDDAVSLAVQWVAHMSPLNVLTRSDSYSVLISKMFAKSTSRQEILIEILQTTFRVQDQGTEMFLVWVPSHVGVEGNEEAYASAKKSLENTFRNSTKYYFKQILNQRVNKKGK